MERLIVLQPLDRLLAAYGVAVERAGEDMPTLRAPAGRLSKALTALGVRALAQPQAAGDAEVVVVIGRLDVTASEQQQLALAREFQ